ncbi:hypothetical protein BH10ACT1_BH10ACT1_37960 [soil metagenome]
MSDVSQGPGWWQASDLKWYPPDQVPGPERNAEPAPATDPGPLGDGAPSTPDWGASAQTSAWGTDVSSPTPAGPSPTYPPPTYAPPTGPGVPYPGAAVPQPGYQAYGAYGPGYAPAYGGGYGSGLPSVSGMATASLVLGILSLVLFWCFFLGGPLAIIGLPLGLVALNKINKGEADPGAKGTALGGAICSGIALVGVAGFLILINLS